MTRYFQDEYTPWSFVLPIALAVMLGALAADVVRISVTAMLAKAAVDKLQSELQQATPGHLPARPSAVEAQEPPVHYEPGASLERLPGLLTANRQGLDRACLGGTVSLRVSNGWSQDMSRGTPEKCVATSP